MSLLVWGWSNRTGGDPVSRPFKLQLNRPYDSLTYPKTICFSHCRGPLLAERPVSMPCNSAAHRPPSFRCTEIAKEVKFRLRIACLLGIKTDRSDLTQQWLLFPRRMS